MNYSNELLKEAKNRYQISDPVIEAYEKYPRHEFLKTFSVDYQNWLTVNEQTLPIIYSDNTLLLYEKDGFISTISQPSFVLRMLDTLDLAAGMSVFELGAGSGWNAALMGHLVGKSGQVCTYEIIHEMSLQAKENLSKFDLPQVNVIEGDALIEVWDLDAFDRGIFTAGAWDMPGILFDVIIPGGKLLFVLKTTYGDILLAMRREEDHFKVLEKIYCRFVTVTGPSLDIYQNDLSALYHAQGEIKIYPQGSIGMGNNVVVGRDMVFQINT